MNAQLMPSNPCAPDFARPTVFVVDDDASMRNALQRGLASAGYDVRTWSSAGEFLAEHDESVPGCLVMDLVLPGIDGLEVQQLLRSRGSTRPIVFVSGRGSVPASVQAMRAGAVTFLPKPVRLNELIAGVVEALERDRRERAARAQRAVVESRLATLTARERDVLRLVLAGRLNKQIAAEFGSAEKTVKVHRGRVMAKMGVRSVAELASMTFGVAV